jgi:hypothetical protein
MDLQDPGEAFDELLERLANTLLDADEKASKIADTFQRQVTNDTVSTNTDLL